MLASSCPTDMPVSFALELAICEFLVSPVFLFCHMRALSFAFVCVLSTKPVFAQANFTVVNPLKLEPTMLLLMKCAMHNLRVLQKAPAGTVTMWEPLPHSVAKQYEFEPSPQ